MDVTPAYDRTDLAAVLAEYERQAQLPPIVLGADQMRAHAREVIAANRAEGRSF